MKKAVLVTDGPSNRDSYLTLPNAQQLRNVPAHITAVGVGGNVDQTELTVSTGMMLIPAINGFSKLIQSSDELENCYIRI